MSAAVGQPAGRPRGPVVAAGGPLGLAELCHECPFFRELYERYNGWFQLAAQHQCLVCVPLDLQDGERISYTAIKAHLLQPTTPAAKRVAAAVDSHAVPLPPDPPWAATRESPPPSTIGSDLAVEDDSSDGVAAQSGASSVDDSTAATSPEEAAFHSMLGPAHVVRWLGDRLVSTCHVPGNSHPCVRECWVVSQRRLLTADGKSLALVWVSSSLVPLDCPAAPLFPHDSLLDEVGSLADISGFLAAAAGSTGALVALDLEVQMFNCAYACIADYEEHLAHKVQQMHRAAVEEFRPGPGAGPDQEVLDLAIQCHLLGGIYDKVFPFWCRLFEKDDQRFARYSSALQQLTPADLDILLDIHAIVAGGTHHLREMDAQRTSYHKIQCIQKCVEEITHSGAAGADEVLPIFIYVVVQSQLPHPLATLSFLNTFRCPEQGEGARAYTLATFESAIRFIEHEGRRRQKERRRGVQLVPALQYVTNGPITAAAVAALGRQVVQLAPYVHPSGLAFLRKGCDLLALWVSGHGAVSAARVRWRLPPAYLCCPQASVVYREEPGVALVLLTDCWLRPLQELTISEQKGLTDSGEDVLLPWCHLETATRLPAGSFSDASVAYCTA
eukprot:EG_transcript_6053